MIEVIRTAADMTSAMVRWTKENKSTGFVPTMGALHEGHISLVQASLRENDITILSVFVNPTQFNNPSDLEKYPRNLDKDLDLLNKLGDVVVFAPEIQEIYPDGTNLIQRIDLGFLEQTMEGRHRPGHFQGVVQVVQRLLCIVPASKLYMGQKAAIYDHTPYVVCLEKQNTIGDLPHNPGRKWVGNEFKKRETIKRSKI